MKGNKGFTLVELSIVLVIIALLAGGIIVGREMIVSAQIRATIQQVENFNTAFNAFFLKYNCMPGDCANGEEFGFTPMTVTLVDARPTPSTGFISSALADGGGDGGGGIPMGMGFTELIIPVDEGQYVFGYEYEPPPEQYIITEPNSPQPDYRFTFEEWLSANAILMQAEMMPPGGDIVRSTLNLKLEVTNPFRGNQAFILLNFVRPEANSLARTAGNWFTLSGTGIPGSAGAATIPAAYAAAMESKVDDMNPYAGMILATGSTVLPEEYEKGMTFNPGVDDGAERCTNNGQYNVGLGVDREATKLCTLMWKPQSI